MKAVLLLEIVYILAMHINTNSKDLKKIESHLQENYLNLKTSYSLKPTYDSISIESLISKFKKFGNQYDYYQWIYEINKFSGMKDSRVESLLIDELLRNKFNSNEKRVILVELLNDIGGDRSVEALIKLLKKSKSEKIIIKVAETLGNLNVPIAQKPLIKRLESVKKQNMRNAIVAINIALAKIGGPEAITKIIEFTNSADSVIKKEAFTSLIESYDSTSVAFINQVRRKILVDPSLAFNKKDLEYLLIEYDWVKTKKQNSFESFASFLTMYPLTTNTNYAFKKINDFFLQQNELIVKSKWDSVCKVDDIHTYEQFLINNPSSNFISSARKRISEIGNDKFINSILFSGRDVVKEIGNKNPGKFIKPLVIIPIITETESENIRFIIKDGSYFYKEIMNNANLKYLPKDYEILKLRYSKPFEASILLIPQRIANDLPKFEKELEDSVIDLIDEVSDFMKVDDSKLLISMLTPVLLLPKNKWPKTFLEGLIRTATNEKESDLILAVSNVKSIFDTDFSTLLVNNIISYLESNDFNIKKLAVESLLSINSPIGNKALVSNKTLITKILVTELTNKDKELRLRSNDIIIQIGDYAINDLVLALIPQNWYEHITYNDKDTLITLKRNNICSILRKIGNPKAIDSLVELLAFWGIGPWSVSVLETFDYKPLNQREKVFYAVATRSKDYLYANWNETKNILMTELGRGNYSIVFTFVGIGNKEVIPDLVQFLDSKGNKTLAEIYINSGQIDLSSAGTIWAARNHYKIKKGDGAHFVSWGSFH